MSCFPRPPTTFWLLLVDQLRAASVARPPLTQEIGLLAAEFFFFPFLDRFPFNFVCFFLSSLQFLICTYIQQNTFYFYFRFEFVSSGQSNGPFDQTVSPRFGFRGGRRWNCW